MQEVRDYQTLGLKPDASPEEVKQAYRDHVKVWHPDRFQNDPRLQQTAQEKLKEITQAYARLTKNRASPFKEHSKTQTQQSDDTAWEVPKEDAEINPSKAAARDARNAAWKISAILASLICVILIVFHLKDQAQKPRVPNRETAHRNSEKPRKVAPVSEASPKTNKPRGNSPSTEITPTTRSKTELAELRARVIEKMKESRASAEKLLALHEEEKNKLTIEYQRRRELYTQGLIRRPELDQVQRALAEAIVRVEEDKRWIAEADVAIMNSLERDALLRAPK